MISLLKQLIDVQSTCDYGEVGVAKIIAEYFSRLGIKSEVDIWATNRANITVTVKGTGEKPGLLFSSHLDVVPAGDVPWTMPPFGAIEVDGKVYGRGTADMKGGVAAAVWAICQAIQDGAKFKGDLIFSGTAGEETDSCGVHRFLKTASCGPLAGIIVTEPTNLEVINCHRGLFWLKITTRGKTAHGSMPHLGINAILKMNDLLNKLSDFGIPHAQHPQLGGMSLSVNMIHAGKAINVIPDECTAAIDIRTLPGQSHAAVRAKVQELLDQLFAADPNFKATIAVARDCPALETKMDNFFVRQLCSIIGQADPKPIGYTTDGPYFAKLNAPIVIFGPGDRKMCHQPNEFIEIKDVQTAGAHYGKIINTLLS